MPQPFRRWTNVGSKGTIIGALACLVLASWFGMAYTGSSYGTSAGMPPLQPIPFSHQHHVGILGIDCRYCHTSVESSSFAGMPPTKTCMNCHSQMWVGSEMLQPVRESYRSNTPIRWKRVNNIPGFAYFDHSIHVQKGIGCSSCHGRIDEMPFTYQQPSLLMTWCLDCHRHPEKEIRPREFAFDMKYQKPADQQSLGAKLMDDYHIHDAHDLTSCSVCHR